MKSSFLKSAAVSAIVMSFLAPQAAFADGNVQGYVCSIDGQGGSADFITDSSRPGLGIGKSTTFLRGAVSNPFESGRVANVGLVARFDPPDGVRVSSLQVTLQDDPKLISDAVVYLCFSVKRYNTNIFLDRFATKSVSNGFRTMVYEDPNLFGTKTLNAVKINVGGIVAPTPTARVFVLGNVTASFNGQDVSPEIIVQDNFGCADACASRLELRANELKRKAELKQAKLKSRFQR